MPRGPENVHVFREAAMTAVELPEWNLVIHGAAFTGPEQAESLLAGFAAPEDGKVHFGLLHGEVEPSQPRYNPIRRQEIADSGLAYLALGHIHKRLEPQRLGRTLCAWPGCIEGRGFDELGPKGFYEGMLEDGAVSVTFVPFAWRRYENLTVDVTGQAPRAAVEAALPPDTARDLYRITLTGETGEARGGCRGTCPGAGTPVLCPGGPGRHPHGGGHLGSGRRRTLCEGCFCGSCAGAGRKATQRRSGNR